MCNRYGFAGGFRVARSANTTRAEKREKARKGALRRAGVREAARGGGGGEGRAKKGRRQIPALGFSIPDFCFPDPEMQFEPIKSMVSRGLSPIGAGWGRRFFKFSRDTHLRGRDRV